MVDKPFHTPRSIPLARASIPVLQPPWISSLFLQCHLQASQCSSPQPCLLGTPAFIPYKQTTVTLGIIRIFHNQNDVGWFKQSRKEKGQHKGMSSYNSLSPLTYQVLPLSGLTGGGGTSGCSIDGEHSGGSDTWLLTKWGCCAGIGLLSIRPSETPDDFPECCLHSSP